MQQSPNNSITSSGACRDCGRQLDENNECPWVANYQHEERKRHRESVAVAYGDFDATVTLRMSEWRQIKSAIARAANTESGYAGLWHLLTSQLHLTDDDGGPQ